MSGLWGTVGYCVRGWREEEEKEMYYYSITAEMILAQPSSHSVKDNPGTLAARQGAKLADMGYEKGVFSWNLPRLGRDLLLCAPHPAGRFLPPGSSVCVCFGAFPWRGFPFVFWTVFDSF